MRALKLFVNLISFLSFPLWVGFACWAAIVLDVIDSNYSGKRYIEVLKGKRWFWE